MPQCESNVRFWGKADLRRGVASPRRSWMTQHGHTGSVRQDRNFQRYSLPEPVSSMDGLGRIECTDGDVISVRVSERKLHCSSVGIHVWLFFQPTDERAPPWQSYVKVVDPKEQEEAVARLGVVGTCQRGMLVGPTCVDRARPFHPSRRFARSSRGQEAFPTGRVATDTT